MTEGEAHGPATAVAGETEVPARHTSPAPQTKELELLEVVADIGRAVADEAVEIAAAEGQDLAAGDAQGSLAVTEHSSEDVPVGEVAVEALNEQRESANKVDQKLKHKCLELREWNDKQFRVLMRQEETLLMTREDVMAREALLEDHKASLDAREREIALQEEKLEATLRSKDEELEVLVRERTKELEDKHGAALDALIADHAAQLKKLTEELDAASAAKTDLDWQVAKLNEDLARGAKEVEALKEGSRQPKIQLADVQSRLSSKTQSLETANSNVLDMKPRIGMLEHLAESRQQLLSKDLDTAKHLRQDAEDRLKHQVALSNLWIKILIDMAERLGAQAAVMGMDGPVFSVSKQEVPSVKLGLFFNGMIEKLKVPEEVRAERFATETRKHARHALFMVLSNIACRHPELDLDDGFKKLLAGADITAAKEKVAPRANRVLHV
nr:autophagy-related protein 11-like [Aegilops tauschii subsp. strangulata]